MSTVGQIEKKTQARVIALLRDRLHYEYLGNWIDRAGNRNIELDYLLPWLAEARRAKHPGRTAPCTNWRRSLATPARACTTATRPSTGCCVTA